MPPTSNEAFSRLSSIQSLQSIQQSMADHKVKVKWTATEDRLLKEAVDTYGTNNWYLVSTKIPNRTGKQCRERWMGQICPEITKKYWTFEEDLLLLKTQKESGNKWSYIAQLLEGRSAISVKNRWNWLSRHQISHNTINEFIQKYTKKDVQVTETKQIFNLLEIPDPNFDAFRKQFSVAAE